MQYSYEGMEINNLPVELTVVWNGHFNIDNPAQNKGVEGGPGGGRRGAGSGPAPHPSGGPSPSGPTAAPHGLSITPGALCLVGRTG